MFPGDRDKNPQVKVAEIPSDRFLSLVGQNHLGEVNANQTGFCVLREHNNLGLAMA